MSNIYNPIFSLEYQAIKTAENSNGIPLIPMIQEKKKRGKKTYRKTVTKTAPWGAVSTIRVALLFHQPHLCFVPINHVHESADISGAIQSVIKDKRMFKYIHHEQWLCSRQMPHIMFIDPNVK